MWEMAVKLNKMLNGFNSSSKNFSIKASVILI